MKEIIERLENLSLIAAAEYWPHKAELDAIIEEMRELS